ncbi:hypothetical protein PTTG_25949 [Puccinia triticina 1-1 BBBD Race 1]|uniref:RING-type domain-containing protein n=2 Tax=Puccinia triticina TaxID=208348 RepID=A0A180GZE7_PUCT1|nr:uncharacterized protein PtA15_16A311 [Puccinia triticina]OAV97739.1 hypothetical protein PTTG_25949 [Puccinia triticina 1-1 BBBD Race 1]WAQ92403.1 hypothetical protein PtA15_16A311 [Puccinia triticina]WAR64142.1 hypothetical protein PtB15_16B302 [Puccinia triticina]
MKLFILSLISSFVLVPLAVHPRLWEHTPAHPYEYDSVGEEQPLWRPSDSADSPPQIAEPTRERRTRHVRARGFGRRFRQWLGLDRSMRNAHQSAETEAFIRELQAALEWYSTTTGPTITANALANRERQHELIDQYHRALAEIQAKAAFDSNTDILGYMPYGDQQKLQIKIGQVMTASLENALDLLATTDSQPGGSGGLGGKLGRTSSKSEKLQDQKTGVYNHVDQPNVDDDEQTGINHDSSSTSIPSDHILSQVLCGDSANNICGICLVPYKSPTRVEENKWSFTKVAKLKNCPHYFHFQCIYKWMVKNFHNSCPICRKTYPNH